MGQALGLPLCMAAFTFVGLAVSSATISIFGHTITDPVQLLSCLGGPIPTCLGLLGERFNHLNLHENTPGMPCSSSSLTVPTKSVANIGLTDWCPISSIFSWKANTHLHQLAWSHHIVQRAPSKHAITSEAQQKDCQLLASFSPFLPSFEISNSGRTTTDLVKLISGPEGPHPHVPEIIG